MIKKISFIFLMSVFLQNILLSQTASTPQKETIILIKTTKGDIKIKLYNETPLHRDNFIKLVTEKYFDGVLFHRVIKGFMIQTGDPDSKNAQAGQMLGNGGPSYTIPAEIISGFMHKKGALAAARSGDDVNPNRESSGSQFYIVQGRTFSDEELDMYETRMKIKFTKNQRTVYKTVGGAPHLDGSYTIFGEVVEGLDIVDNIAYVKCDKRDRPIEDIKIISVTIINP